MKQLYESILKSTQSGKEAVIIDWMKENISGSTDPLNFAKNYDQLKNVFFIKNSKICTDPEYKGWINLLRNPKGKTIEIPSYIKFGECPNACFRVNADRMRADQYPEKCSEVWLMTMENKIKNIKLEADKKVTLVNSINKVIPLEFKNIEIKTESSEFTLEIYGFLLSPDDLRDINIKSKPGAKITLELGGDSVYAFVKKLNLKTKEEINAFCNSFLSNVKGITRIAFERATDSIVFEKSEKGDWERKKY